MEVKPGGTPSCKALVKRLLAVPEARGSPPQPGLSSPGCVLSVNVVGMSEPDSQVEPSHPAEEGGQ